MIIADHAEGAEIDVDMFGVHKWCGGSRAACLVNFFERHFGSFALPEKFPGLALISQCHQAIVLNGRQEEFSL